MYRVRKQALIVYFVLTLLIILLDHLYPGENWVRYIKFTVMFSVFIVAFRTRGKSVQQNLITKAAFFMVIGDFFLNYCKVFPVWGRKLIPLGMFGFALAYLLLIQTFRDRFRFGLGEVFSLFVVLSNLVPAFIILNPFHYDRPSWRWIIILFGLVLGGMVWTLINTIFQNSYPCWVSQTIALVGMLILISDLAVAHSLFNPFFYSHFVPWLENLIWGCFVPAWAILTNIPIQKIKFNYFSKIHV